MRLVWLTVVIAAAAWSQADDGQAPRLTPAWPCTGEEPSFDPVYAQIAEGTGGQVFLFAPGEVAASGEVMIEGDRHRATIARSAGRLAATLEGEAVEVRFPVDPSVESLYIAATIQCGRDVLIRDPEGALVEPGAPLAVQESEPAPANVTHSREAEPGDPAVARSQRYRAGRIAVIPNPPPGVWSVQISGSGPYFLAVKARSELELSGLSFSGGLPRLGVDQEVTLAVDAPAPGLRFTLVDARGEPLQPLILQYDPETEQFRGSLTPGFRQFRVQVEGIDERGYRLQRVDPRLWEAQPPE